MIWGAGAVGNAVYTGCLLRDLLKAVGVDPSMGHNPSLHVAFESVQLVMMYPLCMKQTVLIVYL